MVEYYSVWEMLAEEPCGCMTYDEAEEGVADEFYEEKNGEVEFLVIDDHYFWEGAFDYILETVVEATISLNVKGVKEFIGAASENGFYELMRVEYSDPGTGEDWCYDITDEDVTEYVSVDYDEILRRYADAMLKQHEAADTDDLDREDLCLVIGSILDSDKSEYLPQLCASLPGLSLDSMLEALHAGVPIDDILI